MGCSPADANSEEAGQALTQLKEDNELEQAILERATETTDGNAHVSTEAQAEIDDFRLLALNNSGEGHEKELKNGGMNMTVLQTDGSTGYFLLANSGGQFAVGDRILFQEMVHNVDLFEVPVPN